jgi:hypothetical protein
MSCLGRVATYTRTITRTKAIPRMGRAENKNIF